MGKRMGLNVSVSNVLTHRASYLIWLHHGALAIALALPWLFVLGRAAIDIGISLIAIAFLVRSLLASDWAWARQPWVRVVLALWLLVIVSGFLAYDLGKGLDRALPWGRHAIFAVAMATWVLRDRRHLQWAVASLVGVFAFYWIDSVIQYVVGTDLLGHTRDPEDGRLRPVWGDKKLGGLMAKMGFVAMGGVAAYLWARYGRRGAFAMWLILGVFLSIVFLNGSRMPFLLTGLGCVLMVMFLKGTRFLLVPAVIVLVALVTVIALADPFLMKRITSFVDILQNFGDWGWGQLFQMGIAMGMDHPLIGVGPGNFRFVCGLEPYNQYGLTKEFCHLHPHNIYIEWFAEIGVFGLIGFVAMLVLIGRYVVGAFAHAQGVDRLQLAGAAIAMLLCVWPLTSSQSFFSNWNASIVWTVIAYGLATAGMCYRHADTTAERSA